jgi:hypothetical protein
MRGIGLLVALGVSLAAMPALARREATPPKPPQAAARSATPAAAAVPAAPPAARGARRAPAIAATPLPPPPPDPGTQCRQAILAAEHTHGLAPGLLLAIGRVESGRADPRGGGITPWPWTINAEGQGRYFETKADAVAAVQALQARGVQVIDVGCMQVNLFHHPRAFATLDEAFDPAANARYAGLFLKRLATLTGGDWERAAGFYHSATPERGDAYRQKVMAHWQGTAGPAAGFAAAAPAAPDGTRSFRVNGMQVRALALQGRPDLGGPALSPLLDPTPALRLTGQRIGGRPVYMVQVAQAPEPRRR